MTGCGKHVPTLVFGATSVGKVIFYHHWASLGGFLPSKHIWEDDQVWETHSHTSFGCHKRGKSDFLPSLGFFPPIKTYLGGWASVGNIFPCWFLVPQVWEKWFPTITGIFPHQNTSGRMTKRGKHIPMLDSSATGVGKVIFCHYLTSLGVPFPSKHTWEDDQAWETLSHSIFCHHWVSLGISLPSKSIWEDDQVWEMDSPS